MLTSDKNAKPMVVKFPVKPEETEREWRLDNDDDVPMVERNWSLDDNPDEEIQPAETKETESNQTIELTLTDIQAVENKNDVPPVVVSQPENNIPQKNEPPTPKKTHWKVYAALLGAAGLSIWLSQQSINAYWQQTYHKSSPLESLNDFALWQLGAKIQASVTGALSSEETNEEVSQIAENNDNSAENTAISANKQPENPTANSQPNAVSGSQEVATNTSQQQNDSVVWLHSGDKVMFVGDSIMQGIAPHVQRWLKNDYQIDSVNLSKQSTGLAYPKFFDWPTTIEQTLQNDKSIKLLIVLLGANDPWDIPNPQGGAYLKFQSPEWNQEYLRRVNRIVQAAEANQARIIWLGTPYMRRADLDKGVRHLNQLVGEELVTQSPTVVWLPTDMLLSDTESYQDSMTIDGQVVRVRAKDGVHLNPAGQIFMSNYLNSYIKYK